MHYLLLACDYDGTLALHGHVSKETLKALERVAASGRKLLLVTGRMLEDLKHVFPSLDLFTSVIAENGALLYSPANAHEQVLGKPPPAEFVRALRKRGVEPLGIGRVILSTLQAHETTVLEVIHEQGLEYQIIFNKGAAMILPTGVNKGSGLAAALQNLRCSPHNVVGIGDAENDHSFLERCEYSVAVANALPALKEKADYTTQAAAGKGVREVIELLLADDLQQLDRQLLRHPLILGQQKDGKVV